MKRKSILALIFILSISLVGCGKTSSDSSNGNNSTNKVVEDSNKIKEDVKDTVEGTKDNVDAAGETVNYTALSFKNDVEKAGYKLTDSLDSMKNYFTGKETDYLMGTDIVRVYEYSSNQDVEADIKRIADNGLTITGTDAKYTKKPYYYRKGNSLIVYEGEEPAYVGEFNTMYGNTLIP